MSCSAQCAECWFPSLLFLLQHRQLGSSDMLCMLCLRPQQLSLIIVRSTSIQGAHSMHRELSKHRTTLTPPENLDDSPHWSCLLAGMPLSTVHDLIYKSISKVHNELVIGVD